MKFSLTILALALFVSSVIGQERSMTEPKIIKIPPAKMPAEAKESGLGGRVTVLVSIDQTGKVTSAEDATGPDWVCPAVTRPDVLALRDAAKIAARNARFEPATRNGQPVASTIRLNFDFLRTKVKKDGVPTISPGTYQAASPKDPNRFTVKGDTNFSVADAPPTDYKGPVNTTGSGEKYPVKADESAPPMTLIPGGKTISGGVLNGKALSLPKPPYPPAARAVRASGAVSIQVLIDEEGKVFSAMAVNGHPLLRAASRAAACKAEFIPTRLMGNPVKVNGIITYYFVPQ
jgi:hypothetical protein